MLPQVCGSAAWGISGRNDAAATGDRIPAPRTRASAIPVPVAGSPDKSGARQPDHDGSQGESQRDCPKAVSTLLRQLVFEDVEDDATGEAGNQQAEGRLVNLCERAQCPADQDTGGEQPAGTAVVRSLVVLPEVEVAREEGEHEDRTAALQPVEQRIAISPL